MIDHNSSRLIANPRSRASVYFLLEYKLDMKWVKLQYVVFLVLPRCGSDSRIIASGKSRPLLERRWRKLESSR